LSSSVSAPIFTLTVGIAMSIHPLFDVVNVAARQVPRIVLALHAGASVPVFQIPFRQCHVPELGWRQAPLASDQIERVPIQAVRKALGFLGVVALARGLVVARATGFFSSGPRGIMHSAIFIE
jgi:hypothetical protein